jgi:hypothetical protein
MGKTALASIVAPAPALLVASMGLRSASASENLLLSDGFLISSASTVSGAVLRAIPLPVIFGATLPLQKLDIQLAL